MVSSGVRDGLVQLSCVFSMLGSVLVILTWAYPRKNRTKHGRILLLWLSVADFLSSCIYFIQTFHSDGNALCETSALLGIFFPVASFLWTDCIAYFLYLVVSNRTAYEPYNWSNLLWWFHAFVWSLSLATIVLVFAFGHAGYSSDDDTNDNSAGNTGGWCWITANNPQERFMWELIGGKFIEWTSCLIVLPFLYTTVYFQVAKVEGQQEGRDTLNTTTAEDTESPAEHEESSLAIQTTLSALNPADRRRKPQVKPQLSPVSPTMPRVESIESLYDMSDLSGNAFIDVESSHNSGTTASEAMRPSLSPPSPVRTIQPIDHPLPSNPVESASPNNSRNRSRKASTGSLASSRTNYFTQFYLKLAAVPLVMIGIRFWSSVRIILQYARPHKDNADSFFEVMQALFDPTQGHLNALIFVLASKEDRQNLCLLMQRAKSYVLSCLVCAPKRRYRGQGSGGSSQEDGTAEPDSEAQMRERLILPGGTRSKADSSSTSTHPSLLDVSSDYECNSNERMSEFSFDLTDTHAS
jgi:hypothetical protein